MHSIVEVQWEERIHCYQNRPGAAANNEPLEELLPLQLCGDQRRGQFFRIQRLWPLSNPNQEPCRGESERAGDPDNVNQAHVSLAALDSPYIRPVKVSSFGQGFLR